MRWGGVGGVGGGLGLDGGWGGGVGGCRHAGECGCGMPGACLLSEGLSAAPPCSEALFNFVNAWSLMFW